MIPRKTPLPRLLRQLDRRWADVILRRAVVDGFPRCVVCRGEANQAHHVFRKEQHGRFRFDLRNGLALCAKNHRREKWDAAPVVVKALYHHGQDFIDLAAEVERARGNGRYRWARRELELIQAALEAACPRAEGR